MPLTLATPSTEPGHQILFNPAWIYGFARDLADAMQGKLKDLPLQGPQMRNLMIASHFAEYEMSVDDCRAVYERACELLEVQVPTPIEITAQQAERIRSNIEQRGRRADWQPRGFDTSCPTLAPPESTDATKRYASTVRLSMRKQHVAMRWLYAVGLRLRFELRGFIINWQDIWAQTPWLRAVVKGTGFVLVCIGAYMLTTLFCLMGGH